MPPTAEAVGPGKLMPRRSESTSIEQTRRALDPKKTAYPRSRSYFSPKETVVSPDSLELVNESLERDRQWAEVGTSTVRVAQTLSSLLSRFYTLREPEEFEGFLGENLSLFSLLVQAYAEIRKRFPSSKLSLEILADPEVDDTRMMISILTGLTPDDALLKLDQLDEDWWLAASSQAKDKLALTMEFE